MLKSAPAWAIVLNHFAVHWGVFVLVTWLPTFLHEKLHFDLNEFDLVGLLPFLATFGCAILGGRAADWMLEKQFDITFVRKLFQSLATIAPAVAFALICFEPSVGLTVTLLVCVTIYENEFALDNLRWLLWI
jgi:ACS family sodium-dependent inorganic phosphate cotransporter